MGFEASESAVALVGMDGFRLLAAAEVDGELHQLVETTAHWWRARTAVCGRCRRAVARSGSASLP